MNETQHAYQRHFRKDFNLDPSRLLKLSQRCQKALRARVSDGNKKLWVSKDVISLVQPLFGFGLPCVISLIT